jgi:hypothetical protein
MKIFMKIGWILKILKVDLLRKDLKLLIRKMAHMPLNTESGMSAHQ